MLKKFTYIRNTPASKSYTEAKPKTRKMKRRTKINEKLLRKSSLFILLLYRIIQNNASIHLHSPFPQFILQQFPSSSDTYEHASGALVYIGKLYGIETEMLTS